MFCVCVGVRKSNFVAHMEQITAARSNSDLQFICYIYVFLNTNFSPRHPFFKKMNLLVSVVYALLREYYLRNGKFPGRAAAKRQSDCIS